MLSAASPVGALIEASRPHGPDFHVFHAGEQAHLFVVDGSRIYDLDDGLAAALRELELAGDRPA